jgi:hypothetical protein
MRSCSARMPAPSAGRGLRCPRPAGPLACSSQHRIVPLRCALGFPNEEVYCPAQRLPDPCLEGLNAWDEVGPTLQWLQALERCHAAFGRAPTEDVAELPPIRRLYAQQLRVLHDRLHGLAGTPVEGYIAENT